MQDALLAAQLAVQHDQGGEYGAAAAQYGAAAAGLRRLAAAAPEAQRPAYEARAREYEARVAALRELDDIASLPTPPATTHCPAAPQPGADGSSDQQLRSRLNALQGTHGAVSTEQELQERFTKLAGRPALTARTAQPTRKPAPVHRMSAAEAERYEREQLSQLGLPTQGGGSEVEQLLAEAVASNTLAHRYGQPIEGLGEEDSSSTERSEVAVVLEQAHDAARLEQKYGSSCASRAGGAKAAGGAIPAQMLSEHAHSSDDEDDDMDASVKRWLRSLGLGQHIDSVAAFAHDMEEVAWMTKEQVMLMPMSASERETLLVAIDKLS